MRKPKLASPSERFATSWTPEPFTGCNLWTGRAGANGYGLIWITSKAVYAHRFAWELFRGSIPEGLCILHRCDTPLCVNPDHLFVGTAGDNVRDGWAKGRMSKPPINNRKGVAAYNAKLTEPLVREIRQSPLSVRKLGRQLGVSYSAVNDARRGITWSHVC